MAYPERNCSICKTKHDAALWYYREIETDTEDRREWLCGSKHAGMSGKEQQQWRLWDPEKF